MLRATRCCHRRGARVPHTSHATTARVRWATYTFWYVVDPLLRVYGRYYARKARLDRVLEKNSFVTNCVLGGILGVTAYVALLRAVLPAALPPLPTSSTSLCAAAAAATPTATTAAAACGDDDDDDATSGTRSSVRDDMYAVAQLMGVDVTRELLPFAIKRVKGQMLGKLHSVIDQAERRRRRDALAQLRARAHNTTTTTSTAA